MSHRRPLILWLVLFTVSTSLSLVVTAQEVVINEVMSSNGGIVFDEDGDSPDWIEFYNAGSSDVNLVGYGISDNENPFKWVFPQTILAPTQSLIVFASGKDRSDTAAHWEAVIDRGDEWTYIIPVSEPPSIWRGVGFDDGNWSTLPSDSTSTIYG